MQTSINFQIVENLKITDKVCDESRLIKGLKGEVMKNRILPIRNLIAEGRKEEADALKKLLPAILVSGTFGGGRTADKLVEYSHAICLDLDKIQNEKLGGLKDTICNCPYTFITFISPSGCGLKILVKVSSGPNYHRDAYKQVVKYYSDLLNVKFDEKTCDVSRLTYMSYDPDTYHYPDSEVFHVKTPIIEICKPTEEEGSIIERYRDLYEYAYRYTEKKERNEKGNRNNFLFLLACNCNRYGVPKDVFIKLIEWCDLPANEIKPTVYNGYKKTEDFGTWQIREEGHSTGQLKQRGKPLYEDVVNNTPIIPIDIKRKLPDFLSELIEGYTDERQSDMALTSLLSILSGMMNTKGVYNNNLLSAEFYSMITAPSGSGKSVTGHIYKLFLPLHSRILKDPEFPNGLFIPDNTTTSALIKHLAENGGKGVLFSTDMGFLTHALKRDSAGLQAILRTGQSGENFGNGRNIKRTPISVKNPGLAACLSATPPEFGYLFTATEDGLISRFVHYCFVPDRCWQDIKTTSIVEYNHRQQQASEQILSLHSYTQRNYFEFKLSEEQLLALNETLAEQMEFAKSNNNWFAISPIIKRMGQTAFKLSMIVATIRAWENKRQEGVLTINADDFDIVMKLMHVYFQHAASIVNYVVEDDTKGMDGQLEKLLSALPDAFKRKEAIDTAKKIGMRVSERTLDNWLKKLVELGLLTNEYNNYCKVTKEDGESLQEAA